MVSIMMRSVWYLDDSASSHMMRNKEIFNDLEDNDLQMHIEMEDEERYIMTDIGTITF